MTYLKEVEKIIGGLPDNYIIRDDEDELVLDGLLQDLDKIGLRDKGFTVKIIRDMYCQLVTVIYKK